MAWIVIPGVGFRELGNPLRAPREGVGVGLGH